MVYEWPFTEFCEVEVCPEPRALTRDELLKSVHGKHALLILQYDKINEELINAAGPQLKVIGTHRYHSSAYPVIFEGYLNRVFNSVIVFLNNEKSS